MITTLFGIISKNLILTFLIKLTQNLFNYYLRCISAYFNQEHVEWFFEIKSKLHENVEDMIFWNCTKMWKISIQNETFSGAENY